MNDPTLDLIMKAASYMANKESAEAGQLTLGELAAKLEQFDKSLPVVFQNVESPGSYNSYRGYYEMIALGTGAPCTVGELIEKTNSAIGGTFEGYKGGEYVMTNQTPVWASDYGEASSNGIIGLEEVEGEVVLITKVIE